MKNGSDSERVRLYVKTHYLEPTQKRGERIFTVTAGDVHRGLGLKNRVPVVCTALRSHRFLDENHLVLKSVSGPPSGLSTTVKFTFEITSGEAPDQDNPLLKLYGIAKDVFAELGGGENFIRSEREALRTAVEKYHHRDVLDGEGFATIWQRVVAHAGEQFSTVEGLRFRYAMAGDTVWIERDGRIIDQSLSMGEFRKAHERWPVKGPGEFENLRGPSYVFAILNDSRIEKERGL
jgi:hypothetical protein